MNLKDEVGVGRYHTAPSRMTFCIIDQEGEKVNNPHVWHCPENYVYIMNWSYLTSTNGFNWFTLTVSVEAIKHAGGSQSSLCSQSYLWFSPAEASSGSLSLSISCFFSSGPTSPFVTLSVRQRRTGWVKQSHRCTTWAMTGACDGTWPVRILQK